MRKWSIFILLCGFVLFPSTAGAQGGTQLQAVNVELWSEYDQPSMLVIEEFVVTENTALPAEVTLRFHKDAHLIAVAFTSEGQLLNAEFNGPRDHGDWQVLDVNVRTRDIYRIEYYQPLIQEGNKRKFSFEWLGDYSVKQFNLSAFIPSDSANIVTSPVLSSQSSLPKGLYLTNEEGFGKIRMGESYEFDIEYTRDSTILTNATQGVEVQASDPVGPNTPGRTSIDKLPWIIGGFGLALIAVILFLFSYWRSMQSEIHAAATLARKKLGRRRGKKGENVQIYCHECGTRAQTGDRFCRVCGNKLRVE